MLLGVKHRKVIHKLEKSSDPEDALKLEKALEQAARTKSVEATTNESKCLSISSKGIQCGTSESVILSGPTSPESQKIEPLNVSDNKAERNLPPGYVIITGTQPGELDTFVCKEIQVMLYGKANYTFYLRRMSTTTL